MGDAVADIELPDQGDNIIRTKDSEIVPNSKGIAHELFIHLKKYSKNIAQIDAETGETDTYKELLEKCIRLALHMRKRGINSEDVVSFCTSNHLNSTITMLSTFLIGAKNVSLSPFNSIEDTTIMLDLIRPKLIFVCKKSEEMIEQIVEELKLQTEIVVFGDTEKHTPFGKFLTPFPKIEEDNFTPFEVENLLQNAILVFTSGYNDKPKGIWHNHFSVLSQIQRLAKSQGKLSNFLTYSTIDWTMTQSNILSCILRGGYWMLCSDFNPIKTWKYLTEYDICHLNLSVHESLAFVRYGNPNKLETPKLKLMTVSGGKISSAEIDALKKLFLHLVLVVNSYDLSEIYGPSLVLDIAVPDSAGKPMRGFWYKIINPTTGTICGPDEEGELLVKSKFCGNYYYQHDSSNYHDVDGFLKTGDIAYYDIEHHFFIIDRLNDMLTYHTHIISPTSLESILYLHPVVKIACVIGIPSETDDIFTGIIVKTDDTDDVTEEEILIYIKDQVGVKNIGGGIMFVDESVIPFTPRGQIKRAFLKQRIFEDLDNLDMCNMCIDLM